jgi:hypothetical protein
MNARMPMLALVCSMLMPSYAIRSEFKGLPSKLENGQTITYYLIRPDKGY